MSVTRSLPKMTDQREKELRAFYASCGLTSETIEKAIEARRHPPKEVRLGPGERKCVPRTAVGKQPSNSPAGDIKVPPGIAYRKLAEACLREAKCSPPSMAKSLGDLARVYLRTAEAIQVARKNRDGETMWVPSPRAKARRLTT